MFSQKVDIRINIWKEFKDDNKSAHMAKEHNELAIKRAITIVITREVLWL
jgi:hypothetical protein